MNKIMRAAGRLAKRKGLPCTLTPDEIAHREPRPAHDLLEMHLIELGLPFVREFKFWPSRKWKFDYLLKDGKTAIEIEGGIYTEGRHTRGTGYQRDIEKYNHAVAAGFKLYRFSSEDVLKGRAKDFLREHAVRRMV